MRSGAKMGDQIMTMPMAPPQPQYSQSSPTQSPAARAEVIKEKVPVIFSLKADPIQGNKSLAKGDYQGAIQAYKEAIDIHGDQPVYLTNLAAACLKLDKSVLGISYALPQSL